MIFSIRKKLLLSSLLLLIIPWLGYQSIQSIENDLRLDQEQQLLNRAKLVSVVMQEHANLFPNDKSPSKPEMINHVYVRQLRSAIQLDGYTTDWERYQDRFRNYGGRYINNKIDPDTVFFEHQIGNYKRYLYVVFKVYDDNIIYRRPGSFKLKKSDHVQINLINKKGQLQQFILTTQTPGWITAHRLVRDNPAIPEVRIKGEWQETTSGYNIEVRIPLNMIGNMISFAVADVDDANTREIRQLTGTVDPLNAYALASIIVPSPVVETLLKKIHQGISRTWVIDTNYRVIALVGSLKKNLYSNDEAYSEYTEKIPATRSDSSSLIGNIMRLFYKMVLTQPGGQFTDDLSSASILTGDEFKSAQSGQAATQWRSTSDSNVTILTATHPITIKNQVVGAIAIEQTNASILISQNKALEILINLSILTFLIASTVLILFASRLSNRIRRLRNDADNAIASDGRVLGDMRATNATDEIGDLSRSFSDMLTRLSQYNRYLETMASKLSHELRTPITVVRSSLDNLELKNDVTNSDIIFNRARDGLNRLSNILSRMSEASRLEQTLHNEQKENFNLVEVISSCVDGYKAANNDIQFQLTKNSEKLIINGVPEFIAQLLDKLVSNAIGFHEKNSTILILITKKTKSINLAVSNKGPTLPDEMQNNLFDSMVSIRTSQTSETHLGMGLYIVRLISQFHQAKFIARNLEDNSGVNFEIVFPV